MPNTMCLPFLTQDVSGCSETVLSQSIRHVNEPIILFIGVILMSGYLNVACVINGRGPAGASSCKLSSGLDVMHTHLSSRLGCRLL